MKGDKINDLFNQGMGDTPKPIYDPKRQKYFNQIKKSYSKDELRENFEKRGDKEFENPYRKTIRGIVDKTGFEDVEQGQNEQEEDDNIAQNGHQSPEIKTLEV